MDYKIIAKRPASIQEKFIGHKNWKVNGQQSETDVTVTKEAFLSIPFRNKMIRK
jgi:hypothetical protein